MRFSTQTTTISGERAHLELAIPQIDDVSVLHSANALHAPHAVVVSDPRRRGLRNDLVRRHPRSRPHSVARADDIHLGGVHEDVHRIQALKLEEAPGVIYFSDLDSKGLLSFI